MMLIRSEKAENRKTPLKVLKIKKAITLKNTVINVVVIPSILTCRVKPSKPKRRRYMIKVEKRIIIMSMSRTDIRGKTLFDK